MTPKEKAKELVDKFNDHIEMVSDYRYELAFAKKRALICVDEILNNQPYDIYTIEQCNNLAKYWQDVKIELEKL